MAGVRGDGGLGWRQVAAAAVAVWWLAPALTLGVAVAGPGLAARAPSVRSATRGAMSRPAAPRPAPPPGLRSDQPSSAALEL